ASAPFIGSRLRAACARRRTGRPEPDPPRRRGTARPLAELRAHRVLPGAARGREDRDLAPARTAALAGHEGAIARGCRAHSAGRQVTPPADALPALRPALARVLRADLGDLPDAGRRRGSRSRAVAGALAVAPFVGTAGLRGDQRRLCPRV